MVTRGEYVGGRGAALPLLVVGPLLGGATRWVVTAILAGFLFGFSALTPIWFLAHVVAFYPVRIIGTWLSLVLAGFSAYALFALPEWVVATSDTGLYALYGLLAYGVIRGFVPTAILVLVGLVAGSGAMYAAGVSHGNEMGILAGLVVASFFAWTEVDLSVRDKSVTDTGEEQERFGR